MLVELRPADERGVGVVVGVGINLELEEQQTDSIDQPWRHAASRIDISRNLLVTQLAVSFLSALNRFEEEGFASFASDWDTYNLFSGQEIRIIRGNDEIVGVDQGVDDQGNLLLETSSGLEKHNSGEVSMRPKTPS